ncbi:MAG: hypothetical protein WAV47_20760 [Blastocatellia bacterium]
MSRLDDELRNAFRREQPSDDFTGRLLERIAQQPAPRPRWWQRLAPLLEPPKLRWVAVGVAASLLLAIGAVQYSRMNQDVVKDDGSIAKSGPTPSQTAKPETSGGGPAVDQAEPNKPRSNGVSKQPRSSGSVSRNRLAIARSMRQREQQLRLEGEAAKEKLMYALSIASATLNDAQKAIHDDSPKP